MRIILTVDYVFDEGSQKFYRKIFSPLRMKNVYNEITDAEIKDALVNYESLIRSKLRKLEINDGIEQGLYDSDKSKGSDG